MIWYHLIITDTINKRVGNSYWFFFFCPTEISLCSVKWIWYYKFPGALVGRIIRLRPSTYALCPCPSSLPFPIILWYKVREWSRCRFIAYVDITAKYIGRNWYNKIWKVSCPTLFLDTLLIKYTYFCIIDALPPLPIFWFKKGELHLLYVEKLLKIIWPDTDNF